MTEARTVVWVSAGAASAVAAKLTLRHVPSAVLAYCETGGEHPDNERFLADLAVWCDRPIERLRSERYSSTWDVYERRNYLAGIDGAICTVELKVMPRIAWQRPTDVHVFGYTADGPDVTRAKRLRENYFEMTIRTPLIDRGVTKEGCLALIEQAGIRLPVLYGLGFANNNCIPCVKATSPNYWANVRKHFPAEFDRMATLARSLDVRLCRIDDVREFIDDIPAGWPTTEAIAPSCDFLCHIAEQDLQNAAA
jgi:hypothetical protein